MQPLPLVLAIALFAVVIELVRRRALREEFAALWLLGAGAMVALSLLPSARDLVARTLNSAAAGTGVLLLALLFLCGLALQLSARVSTLSNHDKHLAQQIARLERRIDELGDAPPEEP